MACYPVFFSVVMVLRNRSDAIARILSDAAAAISSIVSDYELIVVDNASDDDSVAVLRGLTGEQGQPNVQVYALVKEVDVDIASWVGLENALGDFVAVVDPMTDDVAFLQEMLERAVQGAEVVFADNAERPAQGLVYASAYTVFNGLYQWFSGVHLAKDAPPYRLLSRRVINFILQYTQPAIAYRHLPATAGFSRVTLYYSFAPKVPCSKKLMASVDRGMRLLVSTTHAPMRLVTTLCVFGAVANLVYSVYVVAVAILKADVAPGWISLSLQQSGMFFLISLVLLVLGEYLLNMVRLANEGPLYYVGQELVSARMTRNEKLNIEGATERRACPADRSATSRS